MNFYGMDIHMSGKDSAKPLTRLSQFNTEEELLAGQEHCDKLKAHTLFKSGKQQIVLGTKDEISIAKAVNGYLIVLINTVAFKTAMLLKPNGIGSRACFATELGYEDTLSPEWISGVSEDTNIELLQAVSLEEFLSTIDESDDLDYFVMDSIKEAFKDMDYQDNYAKFKLGLEDYNAVVAKYLAA